MPAPLTYQSVDIKPLSGPMDTRSSPDSVSIGSWRYRQNVMVVDQGKACRRPGWSRYRREKPIYNNEDLHDQLLALQTYYGDREVPYSPQTDISVFPPGRDTNGNAYCPGSPQTRPAARQPLTFLFEALSTTGVRKLFAGTQNRLYSLDDGKGNWRIIADAYGGDPGNGLHRRWSAAQVNDVITFTNNYDPPLAHILDQPVFGCAMQAVSEIDSLSGIGLSKAGVVAKWKGTVFLGDVEMDGERVEDRVVWSRFKLPLDYTPGVSGTNGTAGYQDLSPGDRILAMEPLADVLLIYTTKSIWQVEAVGGDQTFAISERYREESGKACLAYRRTLASSGQDHYYLAADGIYVYNLYMPRPDRLEWVHKGSSEIFNTIDPLACEHHIGCFYPSAGEYWVSWVEKGSVVPRRTIVFNTTYQTSDVVDHGFTAFCNHAPDDRGTILDFLLSRGICTSSELSGQTDIETAGVKEGGFCDSAGAPTSPENLPGRNTPIWTNNPVDIDGKQVENLDQPSPDANSLCALLGDLTIEDLCQECPRGSMLMLASAEDWCIKEYFHNSGIGYREVATAFTPCGTWERHGYDSILRTGAQDYGYPKEDKNNRALELEYLVTQFQVQPSPIQVRIAYSAQAVDSNNDASGRCAIVWRPLKIKDLECQSDADGDGHIASGTRPNKTMNWSFLYTGRYFYYELRVSGIGGLACFSRLTADVRQMLRSASS